MNHNQPFKKPTSNGENSRMKASIRNGIDAWFDVDEITIHFWASSWTGREIVTLRNGGSERVVSDLRRFRMKSGHQFEYGGHRYRIDFRGVPGKADIELFRDGQLIDSDQFDANALPLNPETGQLDWAAAVKQLAPVVLIGGVFGAAIGYTVAMVLK